MDCVNDDVNAIINCIDRSIAEVARLNAETNASLDRMQRESDRSGVERDRLYVRLEKDIERTQRMLTT
jgi:hypothetical protein